MVCTDLGYFFLKSDSYSQGQKTWLHLFSLLSWATGEYRTEQNLEEQLLFTKLYGKIPNIWQDQRIGSKSVDKTHFYLGLYRRLYVQYLNSKLGKHVFRDFIKPGSLNVWTFSIYPRDTFMKFIKCLLTKLSRFRALVPCCKIKNPY